MNAVIYKYPLSLEGRDVKEVRMPRGASVLTAQMQNGVLCLWALVPQDGAPHFGAEEDRRFLVVGTGHTLPESPTRYLGTVQLMGGALVLHVFELDKAQR